MFIDIHVLQTVPFSNLNRDDNGAPKTVFYGGALRARVSSQSWKRATRLDLERIMSSATTYRTRYPDRKLSEVLQAEGIDSERSDQIARGLFKKLAVIGIEGKKNVVGFYSEQEIGELASIIKDDGELADNLIAFDTAKQATKKDKAGKVDDSGEDDVNTKEPVATKDNKTFNNIVKVLKTGRPTTVALFGRMMASCPAANVDASMSVAHAFSTNEIDIETDFFTATEDFNTLDEGMGSAYITYAEYISATFYRYATIDFNELKMNCGDDRSAATELAAVGLLTFCRSLPSGKNNVTAPYSLPDVINIVVRPDRPVSYAGAFENPIKARKYGYAIPTAEALNEYVGRIAGMVSGEPSFAGVTTSLDKTLLSKGKDDKDDTIFDNLGHVYPSLDKMVDEAVRVTVESS